MRGGEKVLLALARLFPQAPIFTLLHLKGAVHPELEARVARTTFLRHLPGVDRRYRHYLPLFPAAVATLDLGAFDLVVSSSHCVAKGVRVRPGAVHLSYCHTPMRYVWDRFDDYFGPGRTGRLSRALISLVAEGLRAWDVATARGVDHFAANSAHVAARIRRHYGREAEVIPPPVDTEFFTPDPAAGPGDFLLVVSALAPYKRVELILEACRRTGRPLRIVGSGPEEARLRGMAPPEATFLGPVDDQTLRQLYRACRAVVMPGVEDFGIVPLEAMACGRPAVVFAQGGGPESVVREETGLVFEEPTPASLAAALDGLDRIPFDTIRLRRRAEAFSTQAFLARFRAFAARALEEDPSVPAAW
jgi:glycosyltransferase involved in cell wall biosynthesis